MWVIIMQVQLGTEKSLFSQVLYSCLHVSMYMFVHVYMSLREGEE